MLRLLVLALGLGALATAHADDPEATAPGNFYVGAEIGIADSRTMDQDTIGYNSPTRCDVRMYQTQTPPTAAISADPACTPAPAARIYGSRFDAGSGWVAGLQAGYVRDRLRVEAEFLHVEPGSASTPIMTPSTDPALASKDREWSETEPPYEWISNFHLQQYFVNVYYDFPLGSDWTPYVGVGAGWARTEMQFRRRWKRKSIEDDYLLVDPTPSAEQQTYGWTQADWDEWRNNAAGTTSSMDGKISDTLFGFQLLAGVDYALSPVTAVGVKLRWAQFDEFSDHLSYNMIRDHEPVHADGMTPFVDELKFDNIEYWAVTLGFKRRF